jgi:hypothetical protein
MGSVTPAMLHAQQPPTAAPAPAVDPDTAKQIKSLKLDAQDALDSKDLAKAQRLYKQILRLDPDDALALKRSDELSAATEKKKETDRTGTVEAADKEAREARAQQLLTEAENALIAAKLTGDAEQLQRAQQALADARKYARPDDPKLVRLSAQIVQEDRARNARQWALWVFAAVVVVGIVVALVIYFRRRGRLLEIIEGPQTGQVFVLKKDATALGALASEVDWALEDPLRKISRRHCDVLRQGRHYFLIDCSTNGTVLNGRLLQKGQPVLLKRGDQIGLGGEVTLRFR